MQVGRAHFNSAAKRYTILDAPGHKNYVPNMIAGACQADVVAINKMDDSTVEWSQERFEECRDKLMPFLKGCGYNLKKDVLFIPLSAYTAQNILKPVGAAAPWYEGGTFISCLDSLPALDRNRDAPLRLPILSKYKDLGTMVEGKVKQLG